jgi:Tfp pilus assembly PilM family ATPase
MFNNKADLFLELDKKYLKLAQSAARGKDIFIERLIIEPVSGFSEEEIHRALADTISLNGIAYDTITAIIPRDKVIIRYIKLPAVDRPEIEKMISFEISKQTPYSAEDITSDYKVISVDEHGYSRVMLVLSPKTEIARINNILGPFASRLKHIYFSSEAIAGWFNIQDPATTSVNNGYICLVDIDTGSTEIAVISVKGLCFSRSISIGADDISESQARANLLRTRLVDEIKQSIALYLKEKDTDTGQITRFVLTGAEIARRDFLNFLNTAIDIPSEFLRPLSVVRSPENALSKPGIGIPEDVSICAICGGPFVPFGINLVPASQKTKDRKKRLIKNSIIIALFLAVAFSTLLGAGIFKIYQREHMLKNLESMYGQISKVSDRIEMKLEKLRAIKAYLSGGESSLDVIHNLYELMPAGILLLDFDYDDISKSVRFNGRAGRMSDVFGLVSILEGSRIFSNVQARSVMQRQSKEGAVVDFQISCNFKIEENWREVSGRG